MNTFSYEPVRGSVVFGPGAPPSELAGEVARLGLRRLLLAVGAPELELADELTSTTRAGHHQEGSTFRRR